VSRGQHLNRRTLVVGLGRGGLLTGGLLVLGACGLPLAGKRQEKVLRLGVLSANTPDAPTIISALDGLRQGLADSGYMVGRNLSIEYRFAMGDADRLPGLAAELVDLPVDVLLPSGALAGAAAKQSTSTLPIVFWAIADPIGSGLIENFARPGANLTGMSDLGTLLPAKRVELLAQLVPGLEQIGVVYNQSNSGNRSQLESTRLAADALGINVLPLDLRSPANADLLLDSARGWGAQGLIVIADGGPVNIATARFIELTAARRMPAMYVFREYVRAGALSAYGISLEAEGRAVAEYIDRIARGARPGDLPVQQASVVDLAINSTVARELGLTIPVELARQVTEWVQ
jgi:putative ABC transport system substrate-binding protein